MNDPYLYRVYSILSVDDKVVDVCETQTGFRQTEYKGGAGKGGVWLNGRFLWLTGYSQRSANDWAGLGGAYPDWMHDFTLALLRESNGNYVRWMHVSPQRADAAACDRLGIVQVCPAGDKERQVTGRQWEQRVEVMRDAMIFYRNSPSIFFWEAGNTIVLPQQMVQMVELRKKWDPHGGRAMGTRDNDLADANKALTPICEWYGVMIGQAPQTDRVAGDDIFRGYSVARRDKAPLIETEDFRDEAGRNVWDDFSPPHFGFKPKSGTTGGRPVDTWHWNSETFSLAAATRYASYVRNRIDNPDPAHSKWSAYCSIYWTDSDADGRQQGSYVLRVSGKVDGVRLPKSLFYVSRVMQNEQPDIHIIGHWNYPAGTKKAMYVAASHCDQVELFLNGKSLGVKNKPFKFVDTYGGRTMGSEEMNAGLDTGYVYAFPDVAFAPGTLKAVASKEGKVVAQQELQDRRRAQGRQAHAAHRAAGTEGGRQRRGPRRFRGCRRPRPPLSHGRGAGRFRRQRAGRLARRVQCRQAQYDEQPLSRHRVRHQPRRHPIDVDAGADRADRHAARPAARHAHHRRPAGCDQGRIDAGDAADP